MITAFTYANAIYRGPDGQNKPLSNAQYRIGLSPLPKPGYMSVGIERGPTKPSNEPINVITYNKQEDFWRDWEGVVDDEGNPINL